MGYQDLQEGAKGVIHFDPRIIELNQLYAKEILNHPNPYTGMTLAQDPVYVGNEIVNESSIFTDFQRAKLSPALLGRTAKNIRGLGRPGQCHPFQV